jgi:hypothetical protein
MSDLHEQPAAGDAPAVPPIAEPPPPVVETPVAPGGVTATRKPSFPRRIFEWFWRSRALSESVATGTAVPRRARELHRRARLSVEAARRMLEPSASLRHGNGDAVATELYREAVFWALSAFAVARGEMAPKSPHELGALFAGMDRALLLRAAPDADTLAEIEAALVGSSFVDFAELDPAAQKEQARRLGDFTEALLAATDAPQVAVDRLRVQRLTRVGALVLLVFVALPLAFLTVDWSEKRRDLALGKSWKTSSTWGPQCTSPAQKCVDTPGMFFHTNDDDSPWVMIDLGSKKQFSEVRVWNRTDCCPERAVPLVVEVSSDKKQWKELGSRRDVFSTWKVTFSPVKGRFVRVRATRKTYLHLSGIRVLQ